MRYLHENVQQAVTNVSVNIDNIRKLGSSSTVLALAQYNAKHVGVRLTARTIKHANKLDNWSEITDYARAIVERSVAKGLILDPSK